MHYGLFVAKMAAITFCLLLLDEAHLFVCVCGGWGHLTISYPLNKSDGHTHPHLWLLLIEFDIFICGLLDYNKSLARLIITNTKVTPPCATMLRQTDRKTKQENIANISRVQSANITKSSSPPWTSPCRLPSVNVLCVVYLSSCKLCPVVFFYNYLWLNIVGLCANVLFIPVH